MRLHRMLRPFIQFIVHNEEHNGLIVESRELE
jgi:hypothetical protein